MATSSLANAFHGKGKLSSAEFVALFKKYDKDGSGHIEGAELEALLRDVMAETQNSSPSEQDIKDLKKRLLEQYDQNTDGRLQMEELALMLPTEENFLSEFRKEVALTSVEFLKIWYHYDKDRSGYLEVDELEGFLRDLLLHKEQDSAKTSSPFKSLFKKLQRRFYLTLNPGMINDYKNTIIDLYDTNKDGKIELSELSNLLPVEENFMKGFESPNLTSAEFEEIFSHYDRDGNGEIESEELLALMKDVIQSKKSVEKIEVTALEKTRDVIMGVCDTNKDGKLNRNELKLFFTETGKKQVGNKN